MPATHEFRRVVFVQASLEHDDLFVSCFHVVIRSPNDALVKLLATFIF